jgi:hypothetical protein
LKWFAKDFIVNKNDDE